MRRFLHFFGLICVGILSSCRTPSHISIDDETFKRSGLSPKTVFRTEIPIQIEGKARVIFRDSDSQERGIAQFEANQNETLLKLRSGLGFNGGWMYLMEDSVFVYDRIENQLWRYSKKNPKIDEVPLANLSLYRVLFPGLSTDESRRNWESSSYFKSLLGNGNEILIRKSDSTLVQAYLAPAHNGGRAWFCRYANWIKKKDISYPAKIEILSSDGRTNIFILMQEFSILDSIGKLRPNLIETS